MKTDLMKSKAGWHLAFWCGACNTHHGVPVRLPGGLADHPANGWSWNGDRERPTLTPSLRVQGTVPLTDEQADRVLAGEKIEPVPLVCHFHLTDGVIHYLGDSSHDQAGQRVPLEDLP